MRPINIVRQYTKFAPGSVLISYGDTRVLCTANWDDKVPPFLKGQGQGWLTAEYSMLPSSTTPRNRRELSQGKPSGRTNEIQRLIGRSLRNIIDLSVLGERTISIDADVLQADGGTRTAAITGSMIALWDATNAMLKSGLIKKQPIRELLAAVSVGYVNEQLVCDLCYAEDSQAQIDMNVVMTESGQFVEIQGTGEKNPFTNDQLQQMLGAAEIAIQDIILQVKNSLNT